jgi:ribosomal protein L7/L12
MAEATEEKTDKVETTEEKVEIPEKFKGLVEQIDKLSVLELSELVKVLESKALVYCSPKAVNENIAKADAEDAKSKLEAAGASVELQ